MKRGFVLLFTILSLVAQAQSILRGEFSQLAGQGIRLVGFDGLNTYTIDSTVVSEKGLFSLRYHPKDVGMGVLSTADNQSLIVVLSAENILLKGVNLAQKEHIKIVEGKENQLFEQYATQHRSREQALSAWRFLDNLYGQDSLLKHQVAIKNTIRQENERIVQEDERFLRQLAPSSYNYWFLPLRKLVSSVAEIAQSRPNEIATTVEAFRQLDYTDERLYKSGLLKEAIERHFWLIENSGRTLDIVEQEMILSIDRMFTKLLTDEKKLNVVTEYLFNLLEKHSLVRVSEYLALKVLNNGSCTIARNVAQQLESYRAMKVGNVAADIVFDANAYFPEGTNKITSLAAIQSPYTLVVFGSSWCPKCREELPKLAAKYAEWKLLGCEVVFVSLDETPASYQDFAKTMPFISTCDFKKWEGSNVQNYYVFGTPTMFLLDQSRKIVLRPNSFNQVQAWVEWALKRNKNNTNNE